MQAAKGDLLLALTTELCTQMLLATASFHHRSTAINQAFISFPWLRRESSRERDLRVIRKVNRVFETAQIAGDFRTPDDAGICGSIAEIWL